MSEFEDLLHDLESQLASSGDTMPLPALFELRMAVATGHEFVAATERGDTMAAEFHAELLEHHVRSAHTLRCGIKNERGRPLNDRRFQ